MGHFLQCTENRNQQVSRWSQNLVANELYNVEISLLIFKLTQTQTSDTHFFKHISSLVSKTAYDTIQNHYRIRKKVPDLRDTQF